MYDTHKGDITNLVSNGELNVIVHSVNLQGKIGFGVAGALIRKWPRIRSDYYRSYGTNSLSLGSHVLSYVDEDLYVCSAVLQEHYRGSVRVSDKYQDFIDYDAVANVAKQLNSHFSHFSQPVNFHFPKIGGNFANADTDRILETLTKHLTCANETVLWELP